MAKSIVPAVKSGITIKWHVILDPIVKEIADFPQYLPIQTYFYIGNHGAIAGHAHRNIVLDRLNDHNEWVMSLDDDNIIHPGLWEWLKPWARCRCNELADGVIWDQVSGCGSHRLIADPNKIHVHNVDTAQYMLKRSLIGDTRFQEDKYEADGLFIQDIYERNKDSFIIVNQPLCYYNYLRS